MIEAVTMQSLMVAYPPPLELQQPLSLEKRKVCEHIQACRTPIMGGLQLQCDQCGHTPLLYHACRDRHCPQCQFRQQQHWCERQQAAVLPVTYYHLVFTLPHELNAWAQLHPEVIYRLLFHGVCSTLKDFGEDPKHLGGELGITAVLHTWGQNLSQHVHLHCLIPGGALSEDGRWQSAKGNYLFPVRALSRRFRGKMVSALRAAYGRGELKRVRRPGEVDEVLDTLMEKDWVVYSKSCLTHTKTVIDYLGRYSHRIALSDARLLGMEGGRVLLRYQDYRDGKTKVMGLEPEELIRRFLLHVLPKGLMRIRHYGFLANCCRRDKLKRIRAVLELDNESLDEHPHEEDRAPTSPAAFEGYPCPKCKTGMLRVIGELARWRFDGG